MSKFTTIAVVAMLSIGAASSAFAADEFNTSPGLTAVGAPLGLHGVDPVAFLDLNNRVEGSAKYTGTHEGVAYYFASAENLEAFKKNPGQYTPQNGGFCTFGVSVGKKFDGDPQYASIVDDKLYVFLNEEIYKMYLKDKAGTISKAAVNWKEIKHTAAKEL